MKKVISLLLVFSLVFNFSVTVHATTFDQQDLVAIQLIENVDVLRQIFDEMGFTNKDLEIMASHDQQFYIDLLELMKNSEDFGDIVNETLAEIENNQDNDKAKHLITESFKPSLEATEFANRLIYAKKMAEDSHLTDKYPRSLNEDTVYMYIANYIDVNSPSSISSYNYLGDGKKIAPYPYYLTNYCRESYDIYMSKGHGFDILSKGVDLIIDGYNTYSLTKMNDELLKLIKGANTCYVLGTTKSDLESFTALLSENNDPEDVVKGMQENFNSEINDDIKTATMKEIIEVTLALSTGGAQGIVMYLSLESISLFKDIYVNIFDYANWLSLRVTKNFRASERMYRQLGWD